MATESTADYDALMAAWMAQGKPPIMLNGWSEVVDLGLYLAPPRGAGCPGTLHEPEDLETVRAALKEGA